MEDTDTLVLDPSDERISEAMLREGRIPARDLMKKHDLLSPADVDMLCSQEHRSRAFVEGFLSHNSVSVLIGDSGLGKSAFGVQLGLCVAAGLPFLGMKTQRGRVVNVDYENGLSGTQDLRKALVGFLGLSEAPDDFKVWTPDYSSRSLMLEDVCRDVKPALLIIDSLRSHDPYFESTEQAGASMGRLRSAAYRNGVAILAIHHIRKPSSEGVPSLDSEDTVLMQWLNQAAGHRSIINQSDTRIAADLPSTGRGGEMVLRWHRRLYGEGGPLYVERVSDSEGNAIGYQRLTGSKLLGNPEQQAASEKLPSEFSFKVAKQIYGRTDDPTRKFLLKCQTVGLIEQIGRGAYRKIVLPTPASEGDRGDREK